MAWPTEYDCNICTPLLIGKDLLFVTTGEGNGCVMFKLSAAAPEIALGSKGPQERHDQLLGQLRRPQGLSLRRRPANSTKERWTSTASTGRPAS